MAAEVATAGGGGGGGSDAAAGVPNHGSSGDGAYGGAVAAAVASDLGLTEEEYEVATFAASFVEETWSRRWMRRLVPRWLRTHWLARPLIAILLVASLVALGVLGASCSFRRACDVASGGDGRSGDGGSSPLCGLRAGQRGAGRDSPASTPGSPSRASCLGGVLSPFSPSDDRAAASPTDRAGLSSRSVDAVATAATSPSAAFPSLSYILPRGVRRQLAGGRTRFFGPAPPPPDLFTISEGVRESEQSNSEASRSSSREDSRPTTPRES